MGSQRQDHFRDLEQQRDREGSVCTTHTSRSQARSKSHVSQEEIARNMQREIDQLKEACAMNEGSKLHPILISLLGAKRMIAIGAG